MNAEQTANVIAAGAASISILSTAVAIWAVAEARKSRAAAERAATAAERSAQAGQEANELTRDRDRRESAPRFQLRDVSQGREETWLELTLTGPQVALDEVLLIPTWADEARVDPPICWEDEWRGAALVGSLVAGQPVRFQVRGVTGSGGLVVSCKPEGAASTEPWTWDVPLRFQLKRPLTTHFKHLDPGHR